MELAKNESIDTILTDLFIPKMSGLQLLSSLRDLNILTPVIIITGSIDASTLQERYQLHKFQILEKPFDPLQALEIVQRSLDAGFNLRKADPEVEECDKEAQASAEKIKKSKLFKKALANSRLPRKPSSK